MKQYLLCMYQVLCNRYSQSKCLIFNLNILSEKNEVNSEVLIRLQKIDMIFPWVISKFCIGVLLNVILCSCSEQKILGYGTKFGTLLEEESKKVIGKKFTSFSVET